jgi:hypothetical protein
VSFSQAVDFTSAAGEEGLHGATFLRPDTSPEPVHPGERAPFFPASLLLRSRDGLVPL